MDIVTFDPHRHWPQWEEFIVSNYGNPNYVLLSPEFLRWQFLDNPANKTSDYTLWLILHQGQVVAQLGFVPFVGRSASDESFQGAYPINLMVRPEFRDRGLGAILLRQLLRTVPCLLNPGANEAGAGLGKGLGMHDLGKLKRHICVVDEEAARAIAVEGCLPAVTKSLFHVKDAALSDAIVRLHRLPAEAPEIFRPPVAAYAAERSRTFFQWRYETHPAFAYEFFLSSDLQSVVVLHEEREKISRTLVVRMVDLLAREEHLDELLGAVVSAARRRGAAIIDFFCSLGCYDLALQRAGFFDEELHKDGRIAALFQPLSFSDASIRVIASNPPEQIAAPSWYITKADSDQDRPNDKRVIETSIGGRLR